MRIISGKYKSRHIQAPKNLPVRPTTDFAKEGLFNILHNQFQLEECDALDLFCGTGNISYELTSRGAKSIVCVDMNYNCVRFVKKTTSELQIKNIQVHRSDALKFIKRCEKKFDLIFADPPYQMKNIASIPELVFEKELLKPNGWLVLEHSDEHDFANTAHFMEKRIYGKVNFTFFRNTPRSED